MKRLEYKDSAVRIYHDVETCTLIFINGNGVVKSVCYDDNFFYVGYVYEIYMDLLNDYYEGWTKDKGYTQSHKKFMKYLSSSVEQEELNEIVNDYEEARKK